MPKLSAVAALVCLSLCCLSTVRPVSAQTTNDSIAKTLAPEALDAEARALYIRSHYNKFEYRIPMRDGKHLFTSVYVPNDASEQKRYPLLMLRTPYSVAPYGLEFYRPALASSAAYEKDGFIFVFQDVRGTHMSEGEFVNLRPLRKDKQHGTDDNTDTYDTIDWLLKHLPYNNGKVGQWGISYPGYYTAVGAIDSHPALKAVSPQAPIADWFLGDDMHRHGAFNLQMAFGFFSDFGKPRPELSEGKDGQPFKYGSRDGYQFYLGMGSLANADSNYLKGGIPFWQEIVQHPDYDEFWQSRNLLPHLNNVKAAVLTVGGWYDTEDLYGPLHIFAALDKQNPGIQSNLIVGPWTHGGWSRTGGDKVGDASFGYKTSDTYLPVEFAFFKHYLKGGDKPDLPKAWMFETGANRWRKFQSWPPLNTVSKSLYLQDHGKLGFAPPVSGLDAGFDEYLADPAKPVPYTTEFSIHWSRNYIAADQRFAAQRPDVLVYQSQVLDHDVTLAGPLDAELFVSSSGTDADFIVKLIDVNPDEFKDQSDERVPLPNKEKTAAELQKRGGQQVLVRGEPFRARFRDSLATPKPLVPGQPTALRFTMNDVLHTFQRGHRIMIQVQSSWFPFIDRNPQTFVPNIYQANDSDFIKATQRVYHQSGQASRLQVRVLPGLDE